MHLRNKYVLFPTLLACLLMGIAAAQTAQGSQQRPTYDIPSPDPAPTPNAPAASAPAPTANAPVSNAPASNNPASSPANNAQVPTGDNRPAPQAPNQPTDTVRVPAQQGQTLSQGSNGIYTYKTTVNEVQLHATVVDDRNRIVTNLEKAAFTVYENGQPQPITLFARRDIPVAMGLVIDNSGSMREKRNAVNDASINLVKSSNPMDKVFVVNFNDEYWLDVDYTSEIAKLQEGLDKIEARGGTALYDAVVATAEHLKSAPLEKRVILVVTDGEDNASRESLEQAIKHLQVEDGPTVYTIGILGNDSHQRRAKRALQELAEQTGGVAFFPRDLSEVDAITQSVARDIRSQYVIGYKPSIPQSQGGYRTVKVEARAPGHGKLQVRTKSGYYAGQERASAAR
jgi:Ca-activated chloride channel homolog